MFKHIEEKVVKGDHISREDALCIARVSGTEIFELFASANKIRDHFRGKAVDLCSIVNAKSGACSEDCSFCAQSSRGKADIKVYPLLDEETVIQRAREAKKSGANRFSIVTSGRKVSERELVDIAGMVSEIREIGLLPCASLGLLRERELTTLKSSGLERYHHNLETSEGFFPQVCTTHRYADKLKTIEAAKSIGLSLCCGGIFGMGETWRDRIEMALLLRELEVDSVPLNFLIPITGTALARRDLLHPFEALTIVSLYRYILPQKEIRICGGRMQILGECNAMIFLSGADGLLIGNYLTTPGRNCEDDFRLINTYGLTSRTQESIQEE